MLPDVTEYIDDAEDDIAENTDDIQPSYTYKLDFKNKRIMGSVDTLDAVVQAVTKVMQTERFAYEIYDDSYGVELETLLGKEKEYVETVIEQRVEEALLVDDRITSISEFTIVNIEKESVHIHYTVNTIYGDFNFEGVIE